MHNGRPLRAGYIFVQTLARRRIGKDARRNLDKNSYAFQSTQERKNCRAIGVGSARKRLDM